MPLAPGIEDTEELREKYFQVMMKRLEQRSGEPIAKNIVLKRSFCIKDFQKDYHSFKGNAYGLANTLMQTAILKPKMKSAKEKNSAWPWRSSVHHFRTNGCQRSEPSN
jgi:phytoene desaturase